MSLERIKEEIKKLYPNLDDYLLQDLDKLLERFDRINKLDEGHWYVLPYDEDITVERYNTLIDSIKYELIENNNKYPLLDVDKITNKELNESYVDGVLQAVSFIRFLVHCMCDM